MLELDNSKNFSPAKINRKKLSLIDKGEARVLHWKYIILSHIYRNISMH